MLPTFTNPVPLSQTIPGMSSRNFVEVILRPECTSAPLLNYTVFAPSRALSHVLSAVVCLFRSRWRVRGLTASTELLLPYRSIMY